MLSQMSDHCCSLWTVIGQAYWHPLGFKFSRKEPLPFNALKSGTYLAREEELQRLTTSQPSDKLLFSRSTVRNVPSSRTLLRGHADLNTARAVDPASYLPSATSSITSPNLAPAQKLDTLRAGTHCTDTLCLEAEQQQQQLQ